MARNWLSVQVELLGGRGTDLWPWPGRIFAVGPRHTFAQLATAINDAFARWDRAHLSMFTLADGRLVTDEETGEEMASGIGGPLLRALDIDRTIVSKTLAGGEEFQFTFDLGDDWIHRCVVGSEKFDPLEVLGINATSPLPYWGWGTIPDQYGRRWAEDTGQGRTPRRPQQSHPMLTHSWPQQDQTPALDIQRARGAIAERNAAGFLEAVSGRDVDDVLQQLAPGVILALERGQPDAETIALSFVNRLTMRGFAGDPELAEDLLARLRGEPGDGRVLPVDLEELSDQLENSPQETLGGYLDLREGTVYDEQMTDAGVVGEDMALDVDEDPDRWLPIEPRGPRERWQDMAAFAERQQDRTLRESMERAIDGKGAFRRFRDLLEGEGLLDQWFPYATDRRLGRARAWLAVEGIRIA